MLLDYFFGLLFSGTLIVGSGVLSGLRVGRQPSQARREPAQDRGDGEQPVGVFVAGGAVAAELLGGRVAVPQTHSAARKPRGQV